MAGLELDLAPTFDRYERASRFAVEQKKNILALSHINENFSAQFQWIVWVSRTFFEAQKKPPSQTSAEAAPAVHCIQVIEAAISVTFYSI